MYNGSRMQSIHDKIISRIYGNGRGWVFSKKDFSDLGSREAIDVALHRLVKSGRIRRITHGLYDYPAYSQLLKQELSPNFHQAAKALSRKHSWSICPDGETALNVLGLSTQVPARIAYLSDGPTREVDIGGQTIHFKNASLTDMKLKDEASSLVVQGLKCLGKERIDDSVVSLLRQRLSAADKKRILKNTRYVSDWIYEVIKRIGLEE